MKALRKDITNILEQSCGIIIVKKGTTATISFSENTEVVFHGLSLHPHILSKFEIAIRSKYPNLLCITSNNINTKHGIGEVHVIFNNTINFTTSHLH